MIEVSSLSSKYLLISFFFHSLFIPIIFLFPTVTESQMNVPINVVNSAPKKVNLNPKKEFLKIGNKKKQFNKRPLLTNISKEPIKLSRKLAIRKNNLIKDLSSRIFQSNLLNRLEKRRC